jgi:hypothetical protein
VAFTPVNPASLPPDIKSAAPPPHAPTPTPVEQAADEQPGTIVPRPSGPPQNAPAAAR